MELYINIYHKKNNINPPVNGAELTLLASGLLIITYKKAIIYLVL